MMMIRIVPMPMYMARSYPERRTSAGSLRLVVGYAPVGGSSGRPASCHASMPPAIDTAS